MEQVKRMDDRRLVRGRGNKTERQQKWWDKVKFKERKQEIKERKGWQETEWGKIRERKNEPRNEISGKERGKERRGNWLKEKEERKWHYRRGKNKWGENVYRVQQIKEEERTWFEKTKQRKGEECRNWLQLPPSPPPTWLPPLISVLCVPSVFSHLLQHLSAWSCSLCSMLIIAVEEQKLMTTTKRMMMIMMMLRWLPLSAGSAVPCREKV